MSEGNFDLGEIERRMQGAVASLKHEFSGLRTGRANAALLDPIQVNAYGAMMPLTQVGTVSVPEPRMISVQIWDKGLVAAAEKAIRESDLGLNPVVDGQTLRLPIPELNEERRQELVKVASKYAEQAKVAVRNVRRDGMDQLKNLEKSGDISKDEHHSHSGKVQEATDKIIKELDAVFTQKEAEILQV